MKETGKREGEGEGERESDKVYLILTQSSDVRN